MTPTDVSRVNACCVMCDGTQQTQRAALCSLGRWRRMAASSTPSNNCCICPSIPAPRQDVRLLPARSSATARLREGNYGHIAQATPRRMSLSRHSDCQTIPLRLSFFRNFSKCAVPVQAHTRAAFALKVWHGGQLVGAIWQSCAEPELNLKP